MTVRLGKLLQSRIFEQMEDTYPNEGGGFLLGEQEDNGTVIRDIIQVDNVFEEEEQYHRYAMTPQDWMRLEDEAEDRGLMLVGYYHSHPDSPAIPSEYDREHALPNFLYIITSVEMGRATDMRVWKLRADRSVFDREELDVLETD
ncbi:MAG: M67 family metallopeptidase [Chloroflexi bacterium]|nr:M67 family metallopeptidase [Chloroflexota bacterium]